MKAAKWDFSKVAAMAALWVGRTVEKSEFWSAVLKVGVRAFLKVGEWELCLVDLKESMTAELWVNDLAEKRVVL